MNEEARVGRTDAPDPPDADRSGPAGACLEPARGDHARRWTRTLPKPGGAGVKVSFLVPLALFAALAGLLYTGLQRNPV